MKGEIKANFFLSARRTLIYNLSASHRRKNFMKIGFLISLFCLSIIFSTGASAQQSENGVALYEKGEYQKAINVLKKSDAVQDLYYIGLAYEKTGEKGKAKDAFKKSFATSYDIFRQTLIERQKVPISDKKQFGDLLREFELNNRIGLVAAEKSYSLDSRIFQTIEWRIKAKALANLVELAKIRDEMFTSSDTFTSEIKYIERPPAYPPRDSNGALFSRVNQSSNKPINVNIFAVFGADEQIKLIFPLDDVIDAFTVQAFNAVSNIKFKPATKNNKPVMTRATLIYTFSRG